MARVPSSDTRTLVPVNIIEIGLTLNMNAGLARRWHADVQPLIRKDPGRPDADWNWPLQIAPMVLFGLAYRGGRVFQVTVGAEGRPAAMVALLSNERWCLDPRLRATFVFYLSAAPPGWLGMKDASGNLVTPKMVGQAALDVAVCIALNECEGRLWLHAAPKGGANLVDWYKRCGLHVVDVGRHPSLPGFMTGRGNDGRYLCIEGSNSLQAYATHARFR